LNKEDAMDRCKWRKMIKEARWSGWVWVGECSFWYRPTRVVRDQRPLNGRCCWGTAYRVWNVFRVLLCRTFTFGLRTEIEKLKKFVKNLGFLSSPGGNAVTGACRPQLLHKETVLACHSVRRRMTFTWTLAHSLCTWPCWPPCPVQMPPPTDT